MRKFLNPIVRAPIQDCRGNRVYFSPPIVKVLFRRACRGNRVYFSLPRVGFPIWGSPLRASGSPTLLDIIPCRSQIFKIETVSEQHVERGQQKPKSGNCCSFLVFSTLSSSATLTLQYHIYNFKRHIKCGPAHKHIQMKHNHACVLTCTWIEVHYFTGLV